MELCWKYRLGLPKNTSFAVVNCDSVIPKSKKVFFSHYMFLLIIKKVIVTQDL